MVARFVAYVLELILLLQEQVAICQVRRPRWIVKRYSSPIQFWVRFLFKYDATKLEAREGSPNSKEL